ncbi:hypothetical protein SSS_00653, partial [Sarcoptes scabiei]
SNNRPFIERTDHHNNRSWNNDYNPNLLAQSQNDLYSNQSFDANRSQIYRSHPSMIVALPNESSNQPSRASSQLQANSLSSECHYDDRYENRTPQSSSIGSYTIPSVSKSTLTLPIEKMTTTTPLVSPYCLFNTNLTAAYSNEDNDFDREAFSTNEACGRRRSYGSNRFDPINFYDDCIDNDGNQNFGDNQSLRALYYSLDRHRRWSEGCESQVPYNDRDLVDSSSLLPIDLIDGANSSQILPSMRSNQSSIMNRSPKLWTKSSRSSLQPQPIPTSSSLIASDECNCDCQQCCRFGSMQESNQHPSRCPIFEREENTNSNRPRVSFGPSMMYPLSPQRTNYVSDSISIAPRDKKTSSQLTTELLPLDTQIPLQMMGDSALICRIC